MHRSQEDLLLNIQRGLCTDIVQVVYEQYMKRHVLPQMMWHVDEFRKYRCEDEFVHHTDKYNDMMMPRMLTHLHNAISEYELWDVVRNNVIDPKKGFTWSEDPWIYKIMKHPEVYRDGHSGFTMSYSMRIMDTIAKLGWHKYLVKYS